MPTPKPEPPSYPAHDYSQHGQRQAALEAAVKRGSPPGISPVITASPLSSSPPPSKACAAARPAPTGVGRLLADMDGETEKRQGPEGFLLLAKRRRKY